MNNCIIYFKTKVDPVQVKIFRKKGQMTQIIYTASDLSNAGSSWLKPLAVLVIRTFELFYCEHVSYIYFCISVC